MEVPSVKPAISTAHGASQEEKLKEQFKEKGVVINGNLTVNTQEKESKLWHAIKEVRDWGLAGIFILWGGQSIIDRYSKPNDENIKGLIEIIDTDRDGKLSKKEKDDLKELIQELKEWKKVKDQIGNIFGK